MSNWIIQDPIIGVQSITDTSTTQNHPVGKIVKAVHATYGEGEFIYLKGVASTVVGSPVTYNLSTFETALAAVGSNKPQPIAIAMSANVASQWGWYQIGGYAIALKSASVSLAANAAVGILTAGYVAGTGSGKEVEGALVAVVASAKVGVTTVPLIINRPVMQGRVS